MQRQREFILFVLQRCALFLVACVNVAAIFFLFYSLHKISARSHDDIVNTISVVLSVLGLIPLTRFAQRMLGFSQTWEHFPDRQKRIYATLVHLLLWLSVWGIWFGLLPVMSKFNYRSGVTQFENKQYSEAVISLNRALYQNSGLWQAHYKLAELYERLANKKLAEMHYWLGIHTDINYPSSAFNNLARLYMSEQRYYDALDLLDLAEDRLAEHDLDRALWLYRGAILKNKTWAYMKLELWETAELSLEGAWQLLSAAKSLNQYPEVYCMRALLDLKNGVDREGLAPMEYCEKNAAALKGLNRELYVNAVLYPNIE